MENHPINEKEVASIQKQIVEAKAQRKQHRTDRLIAISKILTKDQWSKFIQVIHNQQDQKREQRKNKGQ